MLCPCQWLTTRKIVGRCFFIRLFPICRLFQFSFVLLILAFLLCFPFCDFIYSLTHSQCSIYESLTLFVLSLISVSMALRLLLYFLCYFYARFSEPASFLHLSFNIHLVYEKPKFVALPKTLTSLHNL